MFYTRPFKALKTQATAKNPIPTAANPYPATSSYLKAPKAIVPIPTNIIMIVAHVKTVFLSFTLLRFMCKIKYRKK